MVIGVVAWAVALAVAAGVAIGGIRYADTEVTPSRPAPLTITEVRERVQERVGGDAHVGGGGSYTSPAPEGHDGEHAPESPGPNRSDGPEHGGAGSGQPGAESEGMRTE